MHIIVLESRYVTCRKRNRRVVRQKQKAGTKQRDPDLLRFSVLVPRIRSPWLNCNSCDRDARRAGILRKQELVRGNTRIGEDLNLIASNDFHGVG
jgi:hypothetical protein